MFSLFFNPTFGPINTFLKAVGMEKYIKNWLSDPDIVLFSVILPGIWQYLGYHFVILLAGMQSIPSEIIESARIDGANTVDIFFKDCNTKCEEYDSGLHYHKFIWSN